MVLNYSDSSRDEVSRAHLEWGRLHRERVGPVERPQAQILKRILFSVHVSYMY